MRRCLSIALVIVGAGSGYFTGRSGGSARDSGRSPVPAPRTARSQVGNDKLKEPPARTLARLAEGMKHSAGLPDGVADGLLRLSGEELRDRLVALAGIEVAGATYLAPAVKRQAALEALADELFLREGEAALVWAESTGASELTLALLIAAGGEDPHLVKAWMPRLAPGWDPNPPPGWRVLARVFDSAAARGSGALLEAERIFAGDASTTPAGYPEDFDFAGYLAATQSETGRKSAVKAWAAREPEAVSGKLAEWIDSAGFHARDGVAAAALEGVASTHADAEVVAWLDLGLADVPEGKRNDFLRNLVAHDTRKELAVALTAGLSKAGDRAAVAASGLVLCWNGGAEDYLRALHDAMEREKAVTLWWPTVPEGMREANRTAMGRALTLMDLPPAERAALMAAIRAE